MKLSIGKKLGILVGILLFLSLILGFTAYNGIRTINQQIQQVIEVEQPTTAVAYEMDLNLLRTVVGVLGYLGDRDPTHLDLIKRGREDFNRSQQKYVNLENSEQGKAPGEETKSLFVQFEELADTLVRRDDEQHQKTEVLLNTIDEWEALLEDNIQPAVKVDTNTFRAYQKLEVISEMEADLDKSQRFLGDYLRTHNDKYEKRIEERWRSFEQFLKFYARLQLSDQEQSWLEQLQRLFDETVRLTADIITLEKRNAAGLEQFIEQRRTLGDTVIYEGIIRGTAEKHLSESRNAAVAAVKTANRNIVIILIIGVSFGLVFGIFLSRNITVPLKRVVDAASKIAVGDLAVKLDMQSADEVGALAHSFREMIAYIRDVAEVTRSISEGDLRVDVSLRSAQDVLNTSLGKMLSYIQDISSITEKISNKDLQVEVHPKSDQDVLNHSLQRMVTNLRAMIQAIEQTNWQQNGLNQLNNELLGEDSLLAVCDKAIRFVSRFVNAGYGALYVYDAKQEAVALYSSYAFTERDNVSNRYTLGEGVVGQVALEKSPILLKNIRRSDGLIKTGTTSTVPLNTYTFPLIYDQELYGVLELASFESFDKAKQNFLNETNRAIATAIFSSKQRERVQELLHISQQAQKDAEHAAQEAEHAKDEAQKQAKEVQKANTRLEQQQQQLQQQSEELQQVNAHLKEQQHRLQQQSEELRQQNENLNVAREELDKRAKDLELASKYKSEFLANMSHELRTPLNSIILLSKMLSRNEKGNLNKKDVKQANVIHQAGEELLRLINDILDLSKIEAGKVTLNPTQFSTGSLLDSFKDLFHSIAEEKGLEFIIQDDLNTTLITDNDKLSQVIRNLLANAFKFTRQGSVSLHVLPGPAQKDIIQILVADTGIGIPKDKQRQVFEAFQQADGSTSREFGGTGLGLSIAREYVKLLQGTIKLESEEGEGTTFTLTFPLALKGVPLSEVPEEPETPKDVSPQRVPMPKKKSVTVVTEIVDDRNSISPSDKVMLIIEDNADLAQNTMDVTRRMGFKVLVALDGRTGLSLAAKYRPTGILLDLVLPDINGMEVLRELKSTRELRHIPVHIMSSKERNNTYRAAGAVGYYQKPINDIDIQHAIENLISISEKYPKHLLIVEDDKTQREAIQELFGNGEELKITGVTSQEEAIEEIDKQIYDAAIVDLGLKDGSGYDICKYIKLHNIVLPVIIYTGRELTEDEERELRKYTDSIIIKTARSYERLSDEVSVFLHKMYHGESELVVQPTPPGPLEDTGSLDGKKILIVDDDMKNVFVLASALENNGATIIDAQDGQAALDILRQEDNIDLVLMDIMMPVMDGYTAIREIRKDPKLKHLPIIALTAKALKDDRKKCIQAGADDYLSKPVDYDGLIRLAKAWIEKG